MSAIKKTLPALIDTLQEIAESESDAQVSSSSAGLQNCVSTFEFSAALCVMLELLETILLASGALQSRGIDLDKALQVIDNATKEITMKGTDEQFELLVKKAVDLARECKHRN